jgi:hypothetical protein
MVLALSSGCTAVARPLRSIRRFDCDIKDHLCADLMITRRLQYHLPKHTICALVLTVVQENLHSSIINIPILNVFSYGTMARAQRDIANSANGEGKI